MPKDEKTHSRVKKEERKMKTKHSTVKKKERKRSTMYNKNRRTKKNAKSGEKE